MADRIPDFAPGSVLTSRDLRDLAHAVRARTIIGGPGIKASRTPNGTRLEATATGGDSRRRMYRIQIPAGGIASNDSADVRYYDDTHSLTAADETIKVWNRLGVGISIGSVSAKIGYAAWVDIEQEYQVIQEACS